MKKLIIIVLALVSIQVSAQDKKLQKNHHEQRMDRMKDFTPEEIGQLQTKKIALQLDLTEAQQKQIEPLLVEKAKAQKANRDLHKSMREKGEMPSKEDRLKMMNDRLDSEIVLKEKMKEILDAEQFEKWEKTQNQKHKRKKMHKPQK